MKCFIFDIDGTLADNEHRVHLITKRKIADGVDPASVYVPWEKPDWDEFHARCHLDAPISPMRSVCRALAHHNWPILFVTGRMERCRAATEDWLEQHEIWEPFIVGEDHPLLFMRPEGDTRPDYIIKEEILDTRILAAGYEPIMAFDDRPQVIEMWKRRGILVAAVGAKEPF